MNIKDKIELYLNNMDQCRKIGANFDYTSLSDDDLIKEIQNNAINRYNIMKENNELLNDILLKRDLNSLNDNQILELEEFANKLFDYTVSKDCALYVNIYKRLLEVAKERNNEESIIRYTYNYAIGLFYLNNASNYISDEMKTQVGQLFEGVCNEYFKKYESYDSKTRFYLIRCFANIKLGLNKKDRASVIKSLDIANKVIEFSSKEEIREKNPGIPFDNIIYTTHLDKISCLNFIRNKKIEDYDDFDKELVKSFYDSILYIENKEKENLQDENRLQNWRIGYFSHAIRYHNQMCSLSDFMDYLIGRINSANFSDYSPKSIREIVILTSRLLDYKKFLNEEERKKYSEQINDVTSKAFNYVENLRERDYPQLVNNAFAVLTISQSLDNKDKNRSVLDYILFSHRPTYIHSALVALLTKRIVKIMLQINPSYFINVLGTTSKEEVIEKSEEIIKLAKNGALYHDVGKASIISYISTYERSLFDEEFACVKAHPTFGYELLSIIGEKDLALCALYHHKTYDGFGGYPYNVEKCPQDIKPIVDIISIADSLEAATDFIGRSYKQAKSLETIIAEFENFKGTRYNPNVVELFENEDYRNQILDIIQNARKELYIATYRNIKLHKLFE